MKLPNKNIHSDLKRAAFKAGDVQRSASGKWNYKGPTEGGSDGKRGHSGMEHWVKTKEIKDSIRIRVPI